MVDSFALSVAPAWIPKIDARQTKDVCRSFIAQRQPQQPQQPPFFGACFVAGIVCTDIGV